MLQENEILRVENLSASIPFKNGPITCIEGVSFSLLAGQTLGIIGERESGKSSLLISILGQFERVMQFRLASAQKMRLMSCRIPPPTQIPTSDDWIGCVSGKVLYNGEVITQEHLGGISFVPEDNQQNVAFEFVRRERDMGVILRSDDYPPHLLELRDKAIALFGLEEFVSRARKGKLEAATLKANQFRKIRIIEALMADPKLLLIDQPTDMLEVTEIRQLIDLLTYAQEMINLSVIVTSNDVSFFTNFLDRIAILYAGRIVEVGSTEATIFEPLHPYTKNLMASNPAVIMMYKRRGMKIRLRGIHDRHIDSTTLPSGCVFNPQCEIATDLCRTSRPNLKEFGNDRWVSCHHC